MLLAVRSRDATVAFRLWRQLPTVPADMLPQQLYLLRQLIDC